MNTQVAKANSHQHSGRNGVQAHMRKRKCAQMVTNAGCAQERTILSIAWGPGPYGVDVGAGVADPEAPQTVSRYAKASPQKSRELNSKPTRSKNHAQHKPNAPTSWQDDGGRVHQSISDIQDGAAASDATTTTKPTCLEYGSEASCTCSVSYAK